MDTSRPLVTNTTINNDPHRNSYSNNEPNDSHNVYKLYDFLKMEVSLKVSDQPARIRKLLKLTKTALEKPPLLLIDQQALDFSNEDLPTMMVKLNALFPNSTIMLILSTFEDILEFEECVVMDSGMILEQGKVKDLILNRASNLNHIIINSDPQDFVDLYEKAGGQVPEDTNIEKLHAKQLEL